MTKQHQQNMCACARTHTHTCSFMRHLFLGRKAMTKLDSVLKSRDVTLPTKVCIVRAMAFSVVTYGCELGHKEGCMLKK